ncbi:MAG: cupin, partial [Pseudomonadota bacterium]
YICDQPEVLMPVRGHWRLSWDEGSATLNPGDTCLLPAGLPRALQPIMTGEASMYRVRGTDDPAGKTMPLS